jgi:hypothetical protein
MAGMIKIKIFLLSICLVLFLLSCSSDSEQTDSNDENGIQYNPELSLDNVQAMIDNAKEGDTIVLPTGTAKWTQPLILTKSMQLIGAGIDKTIIVNGIEDTADNDYVVQIIPDNPLDNPLIEVVGFTFDADYEGGCIKVMSQSNDSAYSNFRIHHNKLKNTLDIDGDSYKSICVKGHCFGLIDHNRFENNSYDFKIYGRQQYSWDNFPGLENIGSGNYLYIEDNESVGAVHHILTSGEGARWVYRYNSAEISVPWNALDAHGNSNNYGVVAHEIYGNIFAGNAPVLHDLRGGVGIVFNNLINSDDNQQKRLRLREEDGLRDPPSSEAICPITNTYVWNNLDVNSGRLIVQEVDNSDYNLVELNRDYWTDAEVIDGGPVVLKSFAYGEALYRPLNPVDDDCYFETDTEKLYRSVGDNNWTYIYSPFTYPHPLNR